MIKRTKEDRKLQIIEAIRNNGGEASKTFLERKLHLNFFTSSNLLKELEEEGKIVIEKRSTQHQIMTICILKNDRGKNGAKKNV